MEVLNKISHDPFSGLVVTQNYLILGYFIDSSYNGFPYIWVMRGAIMSHYVALNNVFHK